MSVRVRRMGWQVSDEVHSAEKDTQHLPGFGAAGVPAVVEVAMIVVFKGGVQRGGTNVYRVQTNASPQHEEDPPPARPVDPCALPDTRRNPAWLRVMHVT